MRKCANRLCGIRFEHTTARMLYGKGSRIRTSKFCSTECREVARVGRKVYEERVVAGIVVVQDGKP